MIGRTDYVRRTIGVLVGCAPIELLVASLVSTRGGAHPWAGGIVIVLALAVAALNFYLSAIRAWLYRRANGSRDGYRHISGLPLLGTLLVVAGTLVGFGSAWCAGIGLLATALDTGGSVWFLIATWRDESLWD